MLHDLTGNLAILAEVCSYLFWKSEFLVVLILSLNNVQIYTGTLARNHLGVHAVLSQIHLSAIHLIHQDGWEGVHYLQGKVGGLDNINGRD